MKTMVYMLKRCSDKLFAMPLVLIAVSVALFGCTTDDFDIPAVPTGNGSSLQLCISRIGGGGSTRAYSGNDFTDAEKYVKSVDLFFYPSDANDQTAASHYVRTKPAMSEGVASNTGLLNVSIPNEVIESLFGADPTGSDHILKVYAAVNCEETFDKKGMTLGALKNTMAVSESFVNQTLTDENGDLSDFDGFVMFTAAAEGDIVTFDADNNVINGTVTVNKLTSKIDLYVGFGADGGSAFNFTITDADGNEWKVYNYQEVKGEDVFGDAVEAFIVNGVKKVRIGGAYNGSTFLGTGTDGYLQADDFFDLWYYDEGTGDDGDDANHMNYAQGFKRSSNTEDNTTYPYVIQAPFYTYPNEWTTDVLEQHRTYLILKVNWIPTNSNDLSALQETYYKIPLNVSTNNIKSNQYYRVKVKINTLGGQHFGEPVELTDCSYEILDWGTEDIDAKLRETRYLEVKQRSNELLADETDYYTAVMNNIDQITIPFTSSHKVKIKSVLIQYTDFSDYPRTNPSKDQDVEVTGPGYIRTDIDLSDNQVDNFMLEKEDIYNQQWQGIYIDDNTQTLTLQHFIGKSNLTNNHYTYNDEEKYLYSPYIITIVLIHSDNKQKQEQKIIVKHYPALYIEGEVNTSINLTGVQGSFTSTYVVGEYDMTNSGVQMNFFGFARVNNNERFRTSGLVGITLYYIYNYNTIRDNPFGGLEGLTKAGAQDRTTGNPIMYTISATQLNMDWNKYHIADPRNNYSNTDLNDDRLFDEEKKWSDTKSWTPVNARHIDKKPYVNTGNGSSQLEYYYPTNESLADEDMWTISPKFRIGSAFGAQYGGWGFLADRSRKISRKDARKRCASYTEYGYPAGRWRLPTLGELQVVMKLQAKGVIPDLFADGRVYFTAQGGYTFDKNGNPRVDNADGYVRCVYDDWYWKDAQGRPERLRTTKDMYNDGYVFIWGDRPKNNPQDQY